MLYNEISTAGQGEHMNKRRMDIINDLANLERTSTLAVLTEKYEIGRAHV